jgi:hypothetical protein
MDEDGAGISSDPTEPAIAKPKASIEIVMVPLKERAGTIMIGLLWFN